MMYIQWGDSALMEAAWRGKTGVVKELVEGGADLNLQNKVCQYECTKVHNPRRHAYACFTQKMSDCTYGLQRRECWVSVLYTCMYMFRENPISFLTSIAR